MGKNNKNAIGVFDSGLGGLTVVKELIRQLPNEDIVYFGDTARVPYGTKSKESIIKFSIENSQILIKKKVKCIVVACNSSSSYALNQLRSKFKSLPIIGVIEPGVKRAVNLTKNNKVGIIATTATIRSQKYELEIKKSNKKIKAYTQDCPLFVPLVEEGWINKLVTKDVIREYLAPLLKNKIDTLVLGCTHYPLLEKEIKAVVGKKIILVNSAKEVAEVVKVKLEQLNMLNQRKSKGKLKFFVSDKPQSFQKQARAFLGREVKQISKINI